MRQRVVIERLRLRVPAIEPAAARRLGEDVARELAARLAADPPASRLGTVRVRITGRPDAAEIARRVSRSLP